MILHVTSEAVPSCSTTPGWHVPIRGRRRRSRARIVRSEFSFQQGGRARAGDHQETHVTVGLRVPLR